MATRETVIGVDIGGTKIAAAAVREGQVLRRTVTPTPRDGGAVVVRAVADMVRSLAIETGGVRAVGVGAPGVVDAGTGTVLSATEVLPGWAGTQVTVELERRVGLPVVVDNDVRVMARAEIAPAVAAGARDVLFVSVGTGVGGALARDGRIVRGPHGLAGELAHLLVPTTGATTCGCGRRDHLEAVASGPAIVAEYSRRSGVSVTDVREIVRRGTEGDETATAVVTDAANLLGRVLAGLLSAIDADALVIGGGVAQIGDLFLEPMSSALRAEVLPGLRDIPVSRALLGTDAPLVGAAMLAAEQLGHAAEAVC